MRKITSILLVGFLVIVQSAWCEEQDPQKLYNRCLGTNIKWDQSLKPRRPNPHLLIVNYAHDSVGKKIGDGQCTALLTVSIEGVHGVPHYRLGPTGENKDYVWGGKLGEIRDGQIPDDLSRHMTYGSLLQFRDVKFEGYRLNGDSYNESWPHHSAILDAVSIDRKYICVIHQNVNNIQKVQKDLFKIPDMKSGWIKVYQVMLLPPSR